MQEHGSRRFRFSARHCRRKTTPFLIPNQPKTRLVIPCPPPHPQSLDSALGSAGPGARQGQRSYHTAFSRRGVSLTIATALKRASRPVTVVIDATGLTVFGADEWHLENHGGKPRRTWRKLHLAVNPDTGAILAAALTAADEGDASLVGPLLDQIDCPLAAVIADGAYDGEPVSQAISRHSPEAAVIIPPRSTAVPGDRVETAPSQRDRHILMIRERGRLGWQKAVGYGRRSHGEGTMLRYQLVIGRSLRAGTLPAQQVEASVGCKVLNIMTNLGMPVSCKIT